MGEWQPIETAPKNERILLFRPSGYPWGRVVIGQYDNEQYAKQPRPHWRHDLDHILGKREAREVQPTHWQPLPEAPQ
jgi:hypothetical protein